MKTKSALRQMKITAFCLIVFVFVLFVDCQSNAPEKAANRVSEFAKYSGYSEPVYAEWVRTSEYIEVRDGTKLAADIIRPAVNGIPVDDPLPVILALERYHRSALHEGKVLSKLDSYPMNIHSWMKKILAHGYVIAVVDIRGAGASFGTRNGPFAQEEIRDSYDIIEWLALQSWCDSNVGMFGQSYLGFMQYFAASTAPPHLKAIIPAVAGFDMYHFLFPGGIPHHDFIVSWGEGTKNLDTAVPLPGVDEDRNGKMLKAAVEDHKGNRDVVSLFLDNPYRNSIDRVSNQMKYKTMSPYSYINNIEKSGVAVYHLGGWFDIFTRDEFVWYANLRECPQKLTIGPWTHMQIYTGSLESEFLRWYDYWLKGIDNGIMDEETIHYYTMGAPEGQEWRSSSQWPLPDEKPTPFYFHNRPEESVNSVNDGVLSMNRPVEAKGNDLYTVNYSVTTGKPSRWSNGYGDGWVEIILPEMTPVDKKSLIYTTIPLPEDMEVTGHPIIHLWVTSSVKDGDFFVYLEEIDADGTSNYITEGKLRASHRALSEPPFEYLNLPYHRSFKEDAADLPDEPAELIFDMHPTSNIFDTGHRIRITVTCSDKDNFFTPQVSPAPKVTVYRNSEYPSHVVLPVIPAHSL